MPATPPRDIPKPSDYEVQQARASGVITAKCPKCNGVVPYTWDDMGKSLRCFDCGHEWKLTSKKVAVGTMLGIAAACIACCTFGALRDYPTVTLKAVSQPTVPCMYEADDWLDGYQVDDIKFRLAPGTKVWVLRTEESKLGDLLLVRPQSGPHAYKQGWITEHWTIGK